MAIAGKTILVTGANRGIGQALVEEALSRGAARVYAGTRQPLRHVRRDRGLLPQLSRSRGDIVNVLSILAWAALPIIPSYSISKAAAFSLSQSQRALLAGRGVRVHAVMTGPTDTDMNRGLDIPKASRESVARAILDGVENGEDEIFPDPQSQSLAESWRSGASKALELEQAPFVPAAFGPAEPVR